MTILTYLKKAWALWKRFGQFIGDFAGRVVLTVLYFTIVLPFGLGVRFFSDPLVLKRVEADSFWHARPELGDSLEEAHRQ